MQNNNSRSVGGGWKFLLVFFYLKRKLGESAFDSAIKKLDTAASVELLNPNAPRILEFDIQMRGRKKEEEKSLTMQGERREIVSRAYSDDKEGEGERKHALTYFSHTQSVVKKENKKARIFPHYMIPAAKMKH